MRKKSKKKKTTTYKKYGISSNKIKKIIHTASINSGPIIHHDSSITANASSTGTVTCLTNVAQGLTEHTRRGEETRLMSLRFRWYFTIHPSATVSYVRMMIIRSVDDDAGTEPAVTAVLESAHPNSLVVQDNKKKYIILYDKKWGFAAGSQETRTGNIYINLRNVKASYDNTTSADFTRGHVYVLYLSTEATNTPSLSARARVYMRCV